MNLISYFIPVIIYIIIFVFGVVYDEIMRQLSSCVIGILNSEGLTKETGVHIFPSLTFLSLFVQLKAKRACEKCLHLNLYV